MEFAEALLPELIRDVCAERPQLILYDTNFYTAKYLLNCLMNKRVHVKQVEFYPNFAFSRKMIAESTFFEKNIRTLFTLAYLFLRQIRLSWRFGLSIWNPFDSFFKHRKNLKILAVFPELQPDHEEFDRTFRFVGPCVSEEARNYEIADDDEIKEILKSFPYKSEKSSPNNLRLIYMSLGTYYNNKISIYESVIQAIRDYDLKPGRRFKSSQLRMIMAAGKICFDKLNERVAKGDLGIPPNVLIRPKVPQLEILKRADVFITHCGMNSTSETIKYGVPMIAIPIQSDQPGNAKRCCDELEMGVRLDPSKLSVAQISDSIDEILGNDKYAHNIRKMSKISATYNGPIEGTKIIMKYLNENESNQKKND